VLVDAGEGVIGSPQLSGNRPAIQTPAFGIMDQFEITAELLRSGWNESWNASPVQSTASFKSRAPWAGIVIQVSVLSKN